MIRNHRTSEHKVIDNHRGPGMCSVPVCWLNWTRTDLSVANKFLFNFCEHRFIGSQFPLPSIGGHRSHEQSIIAYISYGAGLNAVKCMGIRPFRLNKIILMIGR